MSRSSSQLLIYQPINESETCFRCATVYFYYYNVIYVVYPVKPVKVMTDVQKVTHIILV